MAKDKAACPECRGDLAIYSGEGNPYKENTGFCVPCGVRIPLGADQADSVGAADAKGGRATKTSVA